MPKTIGDWDEGQLARFVQGAVRAVLAQLPISPTFQSVTATETLASTKKLETTGRVFLRNLPTADPHVVGQLWNNAGVVNVSAG